MLLGTEPSQFRVEKTKTDAVILLSDGETVRGYFFVAYASPRSSGPELVGELLNAETGFFPFELHDDNSGPQTVLYHRHHVVTVALADAEARRDPGYEVARQRFVSVLLSNGARISGSVRVYRPEGRDRLSDWARQSEVFRYIETDTVTMLVNQREVPTHTDSFKDALRAALREDPDILLVGELRDLETVAIAIETAETGHLVFGTLHTTTSAYTIDRAIDQFPADRQAQVRIMLSESLRGVTWRGHGRPERCPDGARDEETRGARRGACEGRRQNGFEALLKRAGLDARPRPQPAVV